MYSQCMECFIPWVMPQNLPGRVESVSTKHKSNCKNGVCYHRITDNYRTKFDVAYKALCLEMREFGVRLRCGIAKGTD